MEKSGHTTKIIIHQSELDFIARCVMDYPNIETGGDFFGFWNKKGNPVIQYVIGPGEKTKRSETSFYQDIDYLKKCGSFLNNKFGLEHIGAWHSHHKLSLSHPSSGDINTMRNALRGNNLPRFLISICNMSRSDVSIGGFLFIQDDSVDYTTCDWEILDDTSPIRESIKKFDTDLFVFPETRNASINLRQKDSTEDRLKEQVVEKPELSEDSYWTRKEGQVYLKKVFEKLKDRDDLSKVEILQLADKRIAISFEYNKAIYEIIFPDDFPRSAPEVIEKLSSDEDGIIPVSLKKMFQPTKQRESIIQKFIHSLKILDRDAEIIIKFS